MFKTHLSRRKIHKQPKSKFSWLKNINIYKYLSFILIFIFISLIPTVISKLIKINKIECSSQFGQCDDQIINSLKLIVNNDYQKCKKELEKQLKGNLRVSNYLIQYKIPSTIKIDLVLNKPKFAVKNIEGIYYLVDKHGIVIDSSKESNLPLIINENISYKVGDTVSAQDLFALLIIEKMNYLYNIESGISNNKELKVNTKEGVLVYFPLEGDVDVLIGSLRLIFSRLNEEANGIRMEDVHEIDLRFKNPLLK